MIVCVGVAKGVAHQIQIAAAEQPGTSKLWRYLELCGEAMALLKGEPGNAVDYRNSGVSCSAKIGTGVEARKREIVFDLQDAARDCWQSGSHALIAVMPL